MASTSFDQDFVVTDKKKIEQIQQDLENAEAIVVREENDNSDTIDALDSIKRWASKEHS